MSKQMRKSRVSASQNSSKTLPKTLPNGGSKKHMIFERIFDNIFQNSKPRNLENINFPHGKSLFLRFSLNSCFCSFLAFSTQKTYQKPFQNEVRTLPKSMPKMCCFLTSFFKVSASIWEALGPPSWSQVGNFGLQT